MKISKSSWHYRLWKFTLLSALVVVAGCYKPEPYESRDACSQQCVDVNGSLAGYLEGRACACAFMARGSMSHDGVTWRPVCTPGYFPYAKDGDEDAEKWAGCMIVNWLEEHQRYECGGAKVTTEFTCDSMLRL